MNYSVLESERSKELPATDKRGALIVYKLHLQAGDSRFPGVELLQKPETTAPAVGDSLEGQIEQTSYGPRFKKAQMGGNQGGKAGGSGGAKQQFEADPKNLRSQNARAAVDAAKDLVIAGKIEETRMKEVAEGIYDLIEAKAKVGE